MVKVTFTLDEDTVARLRRTAARLGQAQSRVVREAIREYEARSSRLSDEERQRLLSVFDRVVPAIRPRPADAVAAEAREIKAARRESGTRRAARARE